MKNNRSIKNFLIEPRFQIRFCLTLLGFFFILSLFYPWVLFESFSYQIKTSKNATLNEPKIAELKTELINAIAILESAYLLIILFIIAYQSHKVAGPLHRFKNHLTEIKDSLKMKKLKFRKHDYFHDLADLFNQSIMAIEAKTEQDRVYLKKIQLYIENLSFIVPDDKKIILEEIIKEINELCQTHKISEDID